MKEPLDDFEEQLFEILKPDARVSNRVVAGELKVIEGAIRHRLRKLTSAKSMRQCTRQPRKSQSDSNR